MPRAVRLGAYLKQRRLSQGRSFRQAAELGKISASFLHLLEESGDSMAAGLKISTETRVAKAYNLQPAQLRDLINAAIKREKRR